MDHKVFFQFRITYIVHVWTISKTDIHKINALKHKQKFCLVKLGNEVSKRLGYHPKRIQIFNISIVSSNFDHMDRTKILYADLIRNFQASLAHQSTVSTYLGEHLKTGISLGIVLSYSIPKSFVLHCSPELCLLWPTSHFTTQILSRPNEQKVHILKSKYFNWKI